MKAYAHFRFLQNPISKNSYLLKDSEGSVKGLEFLKYADTPQNNKLGCAGLEYIRMEIPRNPATRRYFAHTFVGKNVITSTEAINDSERTFGDAKKLGLSDLILIQFSDERTKLDMWFVKDMGNFKVQKQKAFKLWCDGDDVEM